MDFKIIMGSFPYPFYSEVRARYDRTGKNFHKECQDCRFYAVIAFALNRETANPNIERKFIEADMCFWGVASKTLYEPKNRPIKCEYFYRHSPREDAFLESNAWSRSGRLWILGKSEETRASTYWNPIGGRERL